jgi:murein DD-endopeptidase MepM/ murein hydrolase activator NlpD
MKTKATKLIFILLLAILTGCAGRSGYYVQKNGQWVFKEQKVGFMHNFANPRVDNSAFDYSQSERFMWPVPSSKRISSYFGPRHGRHHDGIDIPARYGANVIASDDGKVTYAGRLRGYGKVVVIKHAGGYNTVYAHNSKHFVKKGQKVARGEVICQIGTSGRTSGPHLHYEIRRKNKVRNPASYIPWVNKRRLANRK